MNQTYLTTNELSCKINYDVRMIRDWLKDSVLPGLTTVQCIAATVRVDYKQSFVTRCQAGKRTSEIYGLKWKDVDFKPWVRRVWKTFVLGEEKHTNTNTDDGKQSIQINQPVPKPRGRHGARQVTPHFELTLCPPETDGIALPKTNDGYSGSEPQPPPGKPALSGTS